mmetsp:Transcript_22140/g.76070  ORF Transcript_22140/g.76070 Transcript_22140/m.76070 type:complete len:412 (+) Transcript_22140:34-1269(+)
MLAFCLIVCALTGVGSGSDDEGAARARGPGARARPHGGCAAGRLAQRRPRPGIFGRVQEHVVGRGARRASRRFPRPCAQGEAEVDPDRAEKKVLEARVVCAKTNKAEYETEARRLFQGCLSQGMTMSACQPTSVHSLQMERDGVSRASHDKAKQLWEFKKGAAAEQAEAAGKLATLDAEIAARTTKITALRAQKTAAGVAEIAAEGGLVREGADRCAFHSGAFVGEHAKACLYNAKQLGMSVVDAMPDASKPLALEIVKKHVCLWRRLAIVHALARPSRMLAFEEVEMLKVACKDYGVAFRATFVGRNVPLKTHVLETELPAFAAKWFCCGIMCEDAAESIHALKKRLKRRYACVRDKKKNAECQRNALFMLQDNKVAAGITEHHERRRRTPTAQRGRRDTFGAAVRVVST